MADTYFVGKTELLNWINRTLDLNLSKVEQVCKAFTAAGSLYLLHSPLTSCSLIFRLVSTTADFFRSSGMSAAGRNVPGQCCPAEGQSALCCLSAP